MYDKGTGSSELPWDNYKSKESIGYIIRFSHRRTTRRGKGRRKTNTKKMPKNNEGNQ